MGARRRDARVPPRGRVAQLRERRQGGRQPPEVVDPQSGPGREPSLQRDFHAGVRSQPPAALLDGEWREEEAFVGVELVGVVVVVLAEEPGRLGSARDRRPSRAPGDPQVGAGLAHDAVAEKQGVRGWCVLHTLAVCVDGGTAPQREQVAREAAVPQGRVDDPIVPESVPVVNRERGVAPRQPQRVGLLGVVHLKGLGIAVAADREAADAPQIGRHLGVQILEEIGKVIRDGPHLLERQREAVDVGAPAVEQIGHAVPDRSLHGQPGRSEAQ